jgi:hypothetical protein
MGEVSMRAIDMFEELGFIQIRLDSQKRITFVNNYNGVSLFVMFTHKTKKIRINRKTDKKKIELGGVTLPPIIINCINKYCEELGWLDSEVTEC